MFIAIFPLQLVLFPGETIPLHIFEPRYKQMINECRDEGISFGMPAFVNGSISKYGTEVELLRIMRTNDNGEMDILVRGVRVFHIENVQREVPDKLYSGALVTYPENDARSEEPIRQKLIDRFETLMRITGSDVHIDEYPEEHLSYRIAQISRLTLPQKIEILSTLDEGDREKYLIERIDSLIRRRLTPDSLKLQAGGNGHSKDAHVAQN